VDSSQIIPAIEVFEGRSSTDLEPLADRSLTDVRR